jgi:exportin-1
MTSQMGMEAVAQQLLAAATTTLNGTIEFDVSLLDTIVTAAYSPVDPNRALANKTLMALQETGEHLWTKADMIMERSNNAQTRFFGLQVLDDAIRTRLVE